MAKKHGRISLGRALLLEPNTEYTASPLYRIPHAFEVVSSRGTSHVFRAKNRTLQRHWIQALSTRIVENFENSLMAHAELIVADESIARNKRLTSVAVQPLCQNNHNREQQIDEDDATSSNNVVRTSVLRLGMDVAEYREQCRHVQAILPAKQPIVVLSEKSPRQRATDHEHTTTLLVQPEPLDAETKQLVQAAWDTATNLLARATHVAMEVQTKGNHNHNKHLSRSLETLCRHVDYVITGQHRPLSPQGDFVVEGKEKNGRQKHTADGDPPPMDLFDLLLAELQSLAVASTRQHTNNGDK
jgi:hypothetical protein